MFLQNDVIEVKNCLACGCSDLILTLDLNNQPLANSYKKTKDEIQDEYPLAINRCRHCYHVQLTHAVNPDLMFKEYLYVSGTSKTMNEHFEWFAQYASEYYAALNEWKPHTVFDIGCNDGTQLNKFLSMNICTYGIDPAENLYALSSKKHVVYNDYFGLNFAREHNKTYDVLIAQNVFAHNYIPVEFLTAANMLMDDKSLLFIQTSQANMILNNEFDTIYHEHISFYNVKSMDLLCKRAGLKLIDVTKCPLHGTSYIFVISKTVDRSANITNQIDLEGNAGLYKDDTYIEYAKRCNSVVESLKTKVRINKGQGYKIIGYGAAAKGMTLINYSGIHLDYIVDDNPFKQDKFASKFSVPIVSSDELKNLAADDFVIFIPLAWNFFKEIKEKIKSIRNSPNDMFLTYFPKVELDT